MFYHCRELRFVKYGKVRPHFDPNHEFNALYKWLGFYCGYFPQVWLSQANAFITGFRNKMSRSTRDEVLFGFEICKGFPVSYEQWCLLLVPLQRYTESKDHSKENLDRMIMEDLSRLSQSMREMENCTEEDDPLWGCETLEDWLNKKLFVPKDQFVLPALNLKAAKQIICRNERQKNALRRMGFIDDRIHVTNFARLDW